MKNFTIFSLLVAFLLSTGSIFAQPDTIADHFYTDGANMASWNASAVYQADQGTPTIDGDPSDADWAKVHWLPFQVTTGQNAETDSSVFHDGPADFHAAVKILWDNTTLYILLRYVDDSMVYSTAHNGWYGWNTKFFPTDFDPATVNYPAGVTDNSSDNNWWDIDMIEYYMVQDMSIESWAGQDRFKDSVMVFNNLYPHHAVNNEDLGLIRDMNYGAEECTAALQYKSAKKSVSGDTIFVEIADVPWAEMWPGQAFSPAVNDTIKLGMQASDADIGLGAKEAKYRIRSSTNESRINAEEAVKIALVDEVTMPSYYSLMDLPGSNSAKDVVTSTFAIYPNPANDVIYLSESADVNIYNISGQLLITKDNALSVDISNLNQGIYIIDAKNKVQKLIVK